MGESTPAEPLVAGAVSPVAADPAARSDGAPAPLADKVRAVEEARRRLGTDMDQLNVEVRAQMSQTTEQILWRLVATLSAVFGAIAVRKLVAAIWKAAAHKDPPMNPSQPGIDWGEAVAFSVASGAGAGLARMLATRGATAGWLRATGALPPGVVTDARR